MTVYNGKTFPSVPTDPHNVELDYDSCMVWVRELEAKLEATQHALDVALARLERASAGWVKEIENHRKTTFKLMEKQNENL